MRPAAVDNKQILLFNFVAGETPYQCKLCGEAFARAVHLQQHAMMSHQEPNGAGVGADSRASANLGVVIASSASPPGVPSGARSSPPRKKDAHACFCGKAFPYLSVLEAHMRSHTGEKPFKCSYCEKSFAQKATLQVHERVHTGERPYKCRYCEKTFAQYGTKTVHEKSAHLGQKNYKCPTCGKCLSSPSALYTHKKTHGQKSFQCEFCSKAFVLNNYLKLHIKQVHQQNERHHSCPHCAKTFAYAGSLQVHIRTHTGERPYKCRFCPKAFASQGNLQSHERTHTGERPYVCAVCQRGFVQKSQLTAHEGSHHEHAAGQRTSSTCAAADVRVTPPDYVCKFCGKRYAYASSLYVHTRLHTGERPFKCRYCSKAFTNQGNMQVHERVHTGERPYKCPACDKSYAQKVGLKIHLEQCQRYLAAKNIGHVAYGKHPGTPPKSAIVPTEKEEKKRRLEDLLPKLFTDGRFKSKPAPSSMSSSHCGRRGGSTDSGASTPLSLLSGGSSTGSESASPPSAFAPVPFAPFGGVSGLQPQPCSGGDRLAPTPPSFDFTALLALQSAALANLRAQLRFPAVPSPSMLPLHHPFGLHPNIAPVIDQTVSQSAFDWSKLLPLTVPAKAI